MLSSFLNPFIEHRGLGDLLSKGSGKGGVEPLSITSVCCCYIPLPIPQQPCIFLGQPWSLTQRLKLWFLLLTFLAATNSRRSPPGSCFVAPVSALSCTGPAPLPHTWSHGPTVQARHGKGCIWCEEQFLLRDPHDSPLCLSRFCSSYLRQPPPGPGTYAALSASHVGFHRHPCSGVCQGLDKERGRAGLAIPPVQALTSAGGGKWPCSKTHPQTCGEQPVLEVDD